MTFSSSSINLIPDPDWSGTNVVLCPQRESPANICPHIESRFLNSKIVSINEPYREKYFPGISLNSRSVVAAP